MLKQLRQNFRSLKVNMFHAHLDKLTKTTFRVVDFERRFQSQYTDNVMGDYIWGSITLNNAHEHKRKNDRVNF